MGMPRLTWKTVMTKEEVLNDLKELVIALRDNSEKLRSDPVFAAGWLSKQKSVSLEASRLNSCDASWLNDEYGEWFRQEIEPAIENVDPSVKDKLIWK